MKKTDQKKLEQVQNILEVVSNLSKEGIIMGGADDLSSMEVVSSAVKAITLMGLDLSNADQINTLLQESRRLADKATATDINNTPKAKVFVDPNPSKLVH